MSDFTSEPAKRLYRSKHDRMISGVCGGLADYFSIDVILVRILWIIITLFGGAGLLLYIAGVVIIPDNPDHFDEEGSSTSPMKTDKTVFWGALLIIIGIALVFRQMGFFEFFHLFDVPWQMIWAVLLILLGAFLLLNRDKISRKEKDQATTVKPSIDEPAEPSDKKQIFRSRENKMIGGVCAGLAAYFNLDPTLVRLMYVLVSLASVGIGIVVYIVMVLVFPEEPLQSSETGDAVK